MARQAIAVCLLLLLAASASAGVWGQPSPPCCLLCAVPCPCHAQKQPAGGQGGRGEAFIIQRALGAATGQRLPCQTAPTPACLCPTLTLPPLCRPLAASAEPARRLLQGVGSTSANDARASSDGGSATAQALAQGILQNGVQSPVNNNTCSLLSQVCATASESVAALARWLAPSPAWRLPGACRPAPCALQVALESCRGMPSTPRGFAVSLGPRSPPLLPPSPSSTPPHPPPHPRSWSPTACSTENPASPPASSPPSSSRVRPRGCPLLSRLLPPLPHCPLGASGRSNYCLKLDVTPEVKVVEALPHLYLVQPHYRPLRFAARLLPARCSTAYKVACRAPPCPAPPQQAAIAQVTWPTFSPPMLTLWAAPS